MVSRPRISTSAIRISCSTATACESKRTRSSPVAVASITPGTARNAFSTRRAIAGLRSIAGWPAVRYPFAIFSSSKIEMTLENRCRVTGSPSIQWGKAVSFTPAADSATALASRVRKIPGSQSANRYFKVAVALAGSSANDWTSTNDRTRRAKRRASASPPGPKTRSSVTSMVPGRALTDGCAASVKRARFPHMAEARHFRPC